jgi:uncharacterized protein
LRAKCIVPLPVTEEVSLIIDFHTHVGDLRARPNPDQEPVTWGNLIARLDAEGIDKAVLLPLFPSPENYICPGAITVGGMDIRDQVLEAERRSTRIIPFGNLDPRWLGNSPNADFSPMLHWFKEHGCRGIGEITANVACDDPRTVNMFRQCGQAGLPVLIHNVGFLPGTYGLQDDPGMPRLETLLRQAPGTNIFGHGQGFWAEIGAGITAEEKMRYPEGPIGAEGALPRLLRRCPNLYCDISAGSGHNAITRDAEFGLHFLEEFQDRIVFGTDVCYGGKRGRMPHLDTLRSLLSEGAIGPEIYAKVTSGNALRLLG